MSDGDKLPGWAATAVQPSEPVADLHPQPGPPKRRRLTLVLVGVLALAALGAMAALGYFIAGRMSDDTTATASGEAPAAATDDAPQQEAANDESRATESAIDTGDTATDDGGDENDGAASGNESDEGESDTATSTTQAPLDGDNSDVDNSDVDNIDGGIRHAVFAGGKLFLRGRVPSEAIATEIVTKAGAVVGPDNVFNEYEIDPSVPAELASPLYVEDVILFEFNSIEIREPFVPILDLGTLLLTQNPGVEIVVVTRTDAIGSEAINLEVSQQRGQEVVDFWVRKGIDDSRLSIDARGEADASEDDDDETAALNRRAEFVISGLLDG